MKVHPYADIFPMLPDDELADLAADIKANSLRNPIALTVVAGEKLILDGRNRYRACELAGVEPRYEMVNGETDLLAFVVSQNVKRRNLTAGQRAIAAAEAWIEAEKRGLTLKDGETARRPSSPKVGKDDLIKNPRDHFAKLFGVSKTYVEQARALKLEDPVAAATVKYAGIGLQEKYEALQLRRGGEANEQGRIRKLRQERPDLAQAVADQRMTLAAAEAKARQEADELKQQRWAFTMNLLDSLRVLDRDADAKQTADLASQYDAAHAESRGEQVTPARLRKAAEFLTALAQAMESTS